MVTEAGEVIMTRNGALEYIEAVRTRYWAGGRAEKGAILEEACRVTGYHRKAVIRLLSGKRRSHESAAGSASRKKYGEALLEPLVTVWEALGRPGAKRLQPFLPVVIPQMEGFGELVVTEEQRRLLLEASATTVERLLRRHRGRTGRRPWTSQHAAGVQGEVPVRTAGEWRDVGLGALQADLVSHCAETTHGFYLCSLVGVDVRTTWTILEVVWGKAAERVCGALERGRLRLPFTLRELHTDNGGEFMNRVMLAWANRANVRLTRGRPYRKNDQSWVEQRNWSAARRIVGYQRFASRDAYLVMQRLYRVLELYLNFFQPVRKVVARTDSGARRGRRFDEAQTPYQRLIALAVLDGPTDARLRDLFQSLNPVQLRREIDEALRTLFTLATPAPRSVTIEVTHHTNSR
jgi:hypothetical protein